MEVLSPKLSTYLVAKISKGFRNIVGISSPIGLIRQLEHLGTWEGSPVSDVSLRSLCRISHRVLYLREGISHGVILFNVSRPRSYHPTFSITPRNDHCDNPNKTTQIVLYRWVGRSLDSRPPHNTKIAAWKTTTATTAAAGASPRA